MTSSPVDVEEWAEDTLKTYLASVKWPDSVGLAKRDFMKKVSSLRNPSEGENWDFARHSNIDAVFVTIDRHGTLSTDKCPHFHYNWTTEPTDHILGWITDVTNTIGTVRSSSNIGCCMLLFGLPDSLPRYVFECLVGTLGTLFEIKFRLFEELLSAKILRRPSTIVLAARTSLYSIFADVVGSARLAANRASDVPFGKGRPVSHSLPV